VRHHPQVALTHRSNDHCSGDGVGGEVLELDAIVMAQHPHEVTQRGTEAVTVELGKGDDIALQRVSLLVIRRRCDPLRPH
jgi:hypothetical protein